MSRLILFALFLLCQVAHVLASVWMLLAIIVGSPRAWRIAVSYDQLANAATGGSEDETISSRAYRGTQEGRRGWCLLCHLLDRLDKRHCVKSEGS
ncbi:hypothetical protein [Undibacterium sp. Ren11W]|uniref:hypothetical protein n=1 Tax=Undibacterium sp. Ren11W TaxID=3413045 RepID=UPI003BF1AA7F